MRPDVKLGVVISMVIVFVAGGYYLYRDRTETPIPVATGSESEVGPVALSAGSEQPLPRTARKDSQAKPADVGRSNVRTDAEKRRRRMASRAPAVAGKLPVTPPATGASRHPTASERETGRETKLASGAGRVQERKPAGAQPRTVAGAGGPARSQPSPSRRSDTDSATPDRTPTSPRVAMVDRATDKRRTLAGETRRPQAQGPVPLIARKPVGTRHGVERDAGGGKAAVETHRVQAGDTMSSLSERYYGSVKYVRFLIESNPQIADPDKLTIGMSIKIPAKPASGAVPTTASGTNARPADPARRTYKVQPGDTFYEIARNQLGSSSRWQELFELNKEIVHGDPKRLHVGQVLVLPPP